MNLEFKFENPVNQFHISGPVTRQDVKVMRVALFRFFESNPEYVVLNISQAQILDEHSQADLTQILTELTSLALSKKIQFQIMKNAEEIHLANHHILEEALRQKEELLHAKNKVKEEIRSTAKTLLEENEKLKDQLIRLSESKIETSGSLSTLLDRFWSTK